MPFFRVRDTRSGLSDGLSEGNERGARGSRESGRIDRCYSLYAPDRRAMSSGKVLPRGPKVYKTREDNAVYFWSRIGLEIGLIFDRSLPLVPDSFKGSWINTI
jgi:hypothetical protein